LRRRRRECWKGWSNGAHNEKNKKPLNYVGMNIETIKLEIIGWLIKLEDQAILQKLIELKQATELSNYEGNLKPMSKEEMLARAETSNRDIEAGRVYTIEEVMEENWAV